ncbi:MAG TPA: alanine racemase [Thermodesulfobacteriota bacterium]|nr:alanine racemase [Thermodesulfobacteriota bacterium]
MRPTWAEISLNSLKSNFLQVKRIVGKDIGVMSVVKADAYGHGAVAVSKTLVDLGSEMLGVATVEEALHLRESGIKAPVVVLGGIQPEEAEIVIKNDLAPSIFSISSAQALDQFAERFGKKARLHLEVDTGMNRLGFELGEIPAFLKQLTGLANLEMEGMFTHFANAEGKSRDYTLNQISVFNKMLSLVNLAGLYPKYTHSANSAAIQRYPQSHMNMVRPGIMLYGSGKVGDCELCPVMRLKTRIIQLKRLPAGTPVSYGGTFVTTKPTTIATLPIGYADGYSRILSNRARVSIKEFTAPVVGAVCMDFTMIDVTEVPGVNVGDEVVLLGDERVSVEDVANWSETISYEVLSTVGERVPRVYIG